MLAIKNTLIQCGFSGIWDSHSFINHKCLKEPVRWKLSNLQGIFGRGPYLNKLDFRLETVFLLFRTQNHKLPVGLNIFYSNKQTTIQIHRQISETLGFERKLNAYRVHLLHVATYNKDYRRK